VTVLDRPLAIGERARQHVGPMELAVLFLMPIQVLRPLKSRVALCAFGIASLLARDSKIVGRHPYRLGTVLRLDIAVGAQILACLVLELALESRGEGNRGWTERS